MSNRPHRLCVVVENGEGKRSDFYEIGKMWPMKNGDGFSGKGIHGNLVLMPPKDDTPREERRGGGSAHGSTDFADDIPFRPETRG